MILISEVEIQCRKLSEAVENIRDQLMRILCSGVVVEKVANFRDRLWFAMRWQKLSLVEVAILEHSQHLDLIDSVCTFR